MNMIANREQCLEADALTDLLAGRLPPDRFASAIAHVECCDVCSKAVETAGGSSAGGSAFSFIGRAVRGSIHHDFKEPQFDHEAECQAVVGSLLVNPRRTDADEAKFLPTETLGPYRLLRWLGAGGMGSVYLAEHQRLKRYAAIKLLPREKLIQTGWLDRFNREMTSIGALEHPHVVRAIDAGDDGGWHYLVMEYLDGADLSKVSRRLAEIPLRTTCELIRQAALGLGAIHSLGMTHRDIKPSNLFLTRTGQLKLLDLGLVLSGDSPLATDERLTTVGHLMGTVPYMAREQLMDASAVDWRADIYSLGATMFRLLTGRAPYGPATNLAQTIQAISNSPCPSLKSLKSDVPTEIMELVDAMLSHDPAQRPQSAEEVARLLAPHCEATGPQSLIRAALSVDESEEGRLSSSRQANPLLVTSEAQTNASRSKKRWPLWIAAALLPIVFFAGILLTVTTDRGTLVIESDEPGVSVNVTQGDKVVESLRVEQSEKSVRLHSGKYRIELSGVESDGLEISDSIVLLTRGEKQVVKVKRESTPASVDEPASSDAGSYFQGKSFAHWMGVLEREKDIAVMAQAMHAVKLLAESDAQKASAARKCLLPARQLGGFTMGNRPTEGPLSNDPSGWFMTELVDSFASFFPEPGFTAVIEELEQGNEVSAQACTLLLGCFQQGTANYGARTNHLLDDHLNELVTTNEGRAKLQRLDAAIAKHINSMRGDGMAVTERSMLGQRIKLLDALGDSLADHPQIVESAKQLTAAGDEAIEKNESYRTIVGGGMSGPDMRGINLGRSPHDAWTALMISRTLPGCPGKSVLVGLLEPVLDQSKETQDRATEALARFASEYPRETSAAIIAHLQRLEAPNPGWGGVLRRAKNDPRSQIAKTLLPSTDVDSTEVIALLANAIKGTDPACIFSKADIEDLLRAFAARMTRESLNERDPRRVQKDELALFIFANLGLPFVIEKGERHYEQAACDSLIARNRKLTTNYYPSAKLPAWQEFLAREDRQWDLIYTRVALQALLVRHPMNVISAYASSLQTAEFKTSRTAIIAPLLQVLAKQTVDGPFAAVWPVAGADSSAALEEMTKFIESESSKAVIADLDRAHKEALEKLYPTLEFEDLQALLISRLVLANYLKYDPMKEKGVIDALKKLVGMKSKSGESLEALSLDLLLIAANQLGYEAISLDAFRAASEFIASSEKCAEIRGLVKGLHDSRPEEFCEWFVTDLERIASYLDDAKDRGQKGLDQSAMTLFGGLEPRCEDWYHELIRLLQANAQTKDRANSALRRIIKHLPADQVLLNKMRGLVSEEK